MEQYLTLDFLSMEDEANMKHSAKDMIKFYLFTYL